MKEGCKYEEKFNYFDIDDNKINFINESKINEFKLIQNKEIDFSRYFNDTGKCNLKTKSNNNLEKVLKLDENEKKLIQLKKKK